MRRLFKRPFALPAAFLLTYMVLDWISFVHPFGPFGITPWNPQIGFAFGCLLLLGRSCVPYVILAPVAADLLTRSEDVPVAFSMLISATSGGGYSATCLLLRRLRGQLRLPPQNLTDLTVLFAGAILSSAIVALCCISLYAANGLVAWSQFGAALTRLWVGDLIGITIVVPLMLAVLLREAAYRINWETLVHIALLVIAFALAFGLGDDHVPTFYILFLPIVLIAVRFGYEAVVFSLTGIQLALILVGQLKPMSALELTTLQGLLLVLSITGMTAGMLVSQQRRIERSLRQQQDVQARLHQMGSLGELTSLIAHEVNQPLTAAGTYTRIIHEGIASGLPSAKLQEVAGKAMHQVARAAQVIQRLRELVRLGRSQQESVHVSLIVAESLELLAPDLDAKKVNVEVSIPVDTPLVHVDRIQIEQVLLNLMRNSVEALSAGDARAGTISIAARTIAPAEVEVSVSDDGPGFPMEFSETLHELRSTKPQGLGIGLALSRTIVATHNGRFAITPQQRGVRIVFTLPVAR